MIILNQSSEVIMADKQPSPSVYRPDDAKPSAGTEADDKATQATTGDERPKEIGGRKGPDPTRYGDWEKNGRCIDF